jgi:hypothetical protein
MPFDSLNQNRTGDLELLWDARSKIADEASWVQGRYSDGQRLCLVAALCVVAGSRSFQTSHLERRLARLIAAQLPKRALMRFVTGRQRLMWYNDNPGTSHRDVLGLLDKAIDCAMRQTPVYTSA